MAFTLEQVLRAARDRHPAFHPQRVPNAVAARWLSDYQNALLDRAVARDPQYAAQRAVVVLALGDGRAPVALTPAGAASLGTMTGSAVTPPPTGTATIAGNVDPAFGVTEAIPATETRTAYLVTLVGGLPVLDTATPLVAQVDRPVPLPPHRALLRAAVRFTNGQVGPLDLGRPRDRYDGAPRAWTEAGALYLSGSAAAWAGVASLELTYSPVTPAFAQLPDYFLLPDAARGAVVAQTAAFMAQRVAGLADDSVAVDASTFAQQGAAEEAAYLRSLMLSRRARVSTFREDAW